MAQAQINIKLHINIPSRLLAVAMMMFIGLYLIVPLPQKRHRSVNMLTIFLIFYNIVTDSDWNIIYRTHFKQPKQTYVSS